MVSPSSPAVQSEGVGQDMGRRCREERMCMLLPPGVLLTGAAFASPAAAAAFVSLWHDVLTFCLWRANWSITRR